VHLVGFIIRSIENLAIVQGRRCATELTTDIWFYWRRRDYLKLRSERNKNQILLTLYGFRHAICGSRQVLIYVHQATDTQIVSFLID